MITLKKVMLYIEFGGLIDGLIMKGREHETNGNDWSTIDSFVQDLWLIACNLTSDTYKIEALKKMHEECDGPDVVRLLNEYAKRPA